MDEPIDKGSKFGLKFLTIVLVILVFVGPMIFAWWFIESGRAKLVERNNHGQLIDPPVDFRDSISLITLKDIDLRPGEWAVVYFSNGRCSEKCTETLKTLNLVRSLLGRDGPRLHVWAFLGDGSPEDARGGRQLVDKEAVKELSSILHAQLSPSGLSPPKEGVIVFDWRSQVMMFYTDFHPAGMKQDMSRLLKATRIR